MMSEYKEAEKKIKKSEEKLRSILDNTNDMIVYTDKHGRILDVNKMVEYTLGYKRDELVGKNFVKSGVIGLKNLPKLVKLFQHTIRTGKTQDMVELELKDKNDNEILVEASTKFIKENGKVEGIVSILRDITERKKAEEKRERLIEELQAKNAEMDNFTYAVSHDLKEPLISLSNFSELLLEDYADKLDETGKDYLKRLQRAAIRMGDLIDDLLKLSRIGSKKIEVKNVDLNELLQKVREELATALEEKNVDLRIGSLPVIRCQRTLMGEVFKNLIDNGIKFNEEEKPIVEVECENRKNEYLFSIKDNGIGIEERYLDRIFGIFERLNPREKYEGTGAGLTISEKIVKEHGGKIWAESEVGKGSTFYFTIPKNTYDTQSL